MRAVILAGGEGTRLRPYTTVLPKPLMPVGNFPIAEIIVRQLKHHGVTRITFAVGYLHQLIEAYFGDGSAWGVAIDYLREEQPLGTAGPLAQLDDFSEPLIVLNGDILTDLDFAEFYSSHLDSIAEITIAAHTKRVKIDLGVLKTDGSERLVDYIEKPEHSFLVSMGVYVFSPTVSALIPPDQRYDFPDLVKDMIAGRRTIRAYQFAGAWLDIGRSEDYQLATDTFEAEQERFLPQQGVGAGATEARVAVSKSKIGETIDRE